MAIFERWMRGIGDDGRSTVNVLRLTTMRRRCDVATNLDYMEEGCNSFTSVCTMSLECTALTSLRVTIPAYYLFWEDEAALANFLAYDLPLKSKGIQKFQNTLRALQNLREVVVDIPCLSEIEKETCPAFHKLSPILQYALTRRNAYLLKETKSVVESTQLHQPDASIYVDVIYARTFCESPGGGIDYGDLLDFERVISVPMGRQSVIFSSFDAFGGRHDYIAWLEREHPEEGKRFAQESAKRTLKDDTSPMERFTLDKLELEDLWASVWGDGCRRLTLTNM